MNTLHKKMVFGLTAITAVMFVSCKKADETPVPPVVPPVEASKIQVTGLTATKSTVFTKDSIEFVVTVTNNGGADSAGTTINSTIGTADGGFFTTGKMEAKAVLPKTVKIAPLVAGTHVVTYFTGVGTAKTMKSVTVVVEVPLIEVKGTPTVIEKEAEKELVAEVMPKVTGVTANTTFSVLEKTAATIVSDPANAKIDDNAKATLNALAEIGKVGLTIDPAAKPEIVGYTDTSVSAMFIPLTPKARQAPAFYFVMLELPFSQVKSTVVKADGSVTQKSETKDVVVCFNLVVDSKEIIAQNNLGGITIDIATGAVIVEKGSDVLWTTLANSKEIAALVKKDKVANIALLRNLVGAFAANFGAYGNLGSIANTLPVISVAPVAKKYAEQVGADSRYTTWNNFVATTVGNKPTFPNGKANDLKDYSNPTTTALQTHVFTATDADGDVATYSVETAFTRWTVVGTKVHVQGFVN